MRSEAQRSVLENPSSAESEADLWDNLGLREPKGSLERRALPVTERLSCTPHYLREHYFRLTDEEMGSEVKSPAQGYLGGRICLSNLIQIPSSTLCVCVCGGVLHSPGPCTGEHSGLQRVSCMALPASTRAGSCCHPTFLSY